MKLFDSELQYLLELYTRLDAELTTLDESVKSNGPSAAVESVLRNRDLFSRIEQMNSRLLQLAKEWEKFGPHLDPETRRRTLQLAEKARKQAMSLARAGERKMKEISTIRADLESKLKQISSGTRFLESIKPVKSNYPKFVDSQG
jgi:hypothetical protein